MNDQGTRPLFEALLDTANARLKEYDDLICNTREIMDRLNSRRLKSEAMPTKSADPPTEMENTVTNRFAIFCSSFEQSNKKMEELYARLKELA